MTDYLSNKFKWLSFFATWAVVGLHSRTLRWSASEDWTNTLQAQIIHVFDWAVPIFFVISGYLFVSSYERHGYGELLRKKFWSLYLPCVLWMVLSELLTLPINVYCHAVPSWDIILYAPLFMYEKFSISFHFWYVRDLLLVFVLAPVFFWLTKTARLAWVAALVAMVFFSVCDWSPVQMWGYTFQYYGMTIPFVLLGMALARSKIRENNAIVRKCSPLIVAILLPVIVFLWKEAHFELPFRICLVACVWFGYDSLVWFLGNMWQMHYPEVLRGAFMVYCMHLIVIRYVSGSGRILFGDGCWMKMVFFGVNFMSFWLSLALTKVLSRSVPSVYRFLSGGR